jgi:hypothetical protein
MKKTKAVARWAALISIALPAASLPACHTGTESGLEASGNVGQVQKATGIDHSQVCFINDKYMGKPQIPVEVDGKTYYGCCAGCATALRHDPSTRVATDPYNGARVDKAMAFIARNPADRDTVLYFQSAATFAAYSQTLR